MSVYTTPERARPRILFEAVPEDVLPSLVDLAGTYETIAERTTLHETDWDLLVTFAHDGAGRDDSLHILSFGASLGDLITLAGTPQRLICDYPTTALDGRTEVTNPILRKLLARTVIDTLPSETKRTWRPANRCGYWFPRDRREVLASVGRERFVVAYHTNPRDRRSAAWFLPDHTVEHRQWLEFVLEELSRVDPERFPGPPEWRTAPAWATPRLADAMVEVGVIAEERRRVLAELEDREVAAQDLVSHCTREAEEGMWRLLTGTGEALECAVQMCLENFGFTVEAMDEQHVDTRTRGRLEDLRVWSPDSDTWICLAEVKGYLKGAKVNDVSQILTRPVVNYLKETGSEPDAVWHIVNTFRDIDPSRRDEPIDDEVALEPLAAAGGALIDTRDLFRAWREVESRVVSQEEVRKSLVDARKRWEWREQLS